jgi:hypothetical protein
VWVKIKRSHPQSIVTFVRGTPLDGASDERFHACTLGESSRSRR